jgi:hypothetical protein
MALRKSESASLEAQNGSFARTQRMGISGFHFFAIISTLRSETLAILRKSSSRDRIVSAPSATAVPAISTSDAFPQVGLLLRVHPLFPLPLLLFVNLEQRGSISVRRSTRSSPGQLVSCIEEGATVQKRYRGNTNRIHSGLNRL